MPRRASNVRYAGCYRVLLAGGQGERLWPLTRDRAKPAVPSALSTASSTLRSPTASNSNLRRIFILTQYKALSLNRHIRAGWSPLAGLGDYIEVLPPQMRVSQQWYQAPPTLCTRTSTPSAANARNSFSSFSGDHIYKMNYSRMLKQHCDSGADVTVRHHRIPAPRLPNSSASLRPTKNGASSAFEEKPAVPKESPHHPGHCNASMGIYIFNTQLLIPILLADSRGSQVAPRFWQGHSSRIISKHRRFSYNFVDENAKDALYWRDVGTLDAYYEANMDLVSVSPVFNLMTLPGRCAPGSNSIRGKFVSPIPSAWASRSIPLWLVARSSPGACSKIRDRQQCPRQQLQRSLEFHHLNHVNIGRHSRIRRAPSSTAT